MNKNRCFDHVLSADYYDAEEALEAVQQYERDTGMRPSAVVPILEMNVHVSVEIARKYGLASVSDACLSTARDKHNMKEAFESAGVPCARHRPYSTLTELRKVARELRFPLVLKPRDFAGNVGTVKVDSEKELDAAFEYCREGLLDIAPIYKFKDGRFQAEEFVESTHEVSVEVLNHGEQRAVIAVTDKAKLPPPYFTEFGQLVPSRETYNQTIRELSIAACEALDIRRGLAHVEILVNDSELNVVEVAARPGGDGIMDLVSRVYGFNPYDLHYGSYLNNFHQIPELPSTPLGVGATVFLKADVGRVEQVNDVENPTDDEVALYPVLKEGAESRPATSYQSRDGVMEFFRPGAGTEDAVDFQREVLTIAAQRSQEVFTVTS
ncbi:ATP-grasp domain-containing protein [Lipingzhangella sp. LS1_29]|uniref:ATP-grasp domain-containing protein n=1 Tax=Lipingzhangella rawalii TaxID=2055835 RepID=A0ABU2HBF8_9ACTN|nr:ATP-grasp domain-containing protein [Lipingzhangella rawalii]MDS1272598.1 ATP-grasp domain-containing protein [Lipingzhangella rawalii]